MTLLEQLRNIREQPRGPTYKALHELCGEAADEIERLLGLLREAHETLCSEAGDLHRESDLGERIAAALEQSLGPKP